MTKHLFAQTIQDKVIGTRKESPVKLDRTRKFDMYFCVFFFFFFLLLLPKFDFLKGGWALGFVSIQIWEFFNVSLFPEILSLKLFCNSWGSSYTKFIVLDIKFRFNCGKSDLY